MDEDRKLFDTFALRRSSAWGARVQPYVYNLMGERHNKGGAYKEAQCHFSKSAHFPIFSKAEPSDASAGQRLLRTSTTMLLDCEHTLNGAPYLARSPDLAPQFWCAHFSNQRTRYAQGIHPVQCYDCVTA